MKKLKLQDFKASELLTRDQLKKITGGDSSDAGCPTGKFWCRCTNGDSGVLFCASSIQECWDAC